MSGDATIARLMTDATIARLLAGRQQPIARTRVRAGNASAPAAPAPRTVNDASDTRVSLASSPSTSSGGDRFVPVAVANRDGQGLPEEVVVAGKVIVTLPVFDDKHRIIGSIYEQKACKILPRSVLYATWAGQGPLDLSDLVKGRVAPKHEAAHLARNGKIRARVNGEGIVIGFHLSR